MNNSTKNVQAKVTVGLKDKTASMARRRISQFLGPAKVIAVENFPLSGPIHRQTKAQAIASLREDRAQHLTLKGKTCVACTGRKK